MHVLFLLDYQLKPVNETPNSELDLVPSIHSYPDDCPFNVLAVPHPINLIRFLANSALPSLIIATTKWTLMKLCAVNTYSSPPA